MRSCSVFNPITRGLQTGNFSGLTFLSSFHSLQYFFPPSSSSSKNANSYVFDPFLTSKVALSSPNLVLCPGIPAQAAAVTIYVPSAASPGIVNEELHVFVSPELINALSHIPYPNSTFSHTGSEHPSQVCPFVHTTRFPSGPSISKPR